MKRQLLTLSLAMIVAAPVLGGEKHKHDDQHGHKHDHDHTKSVEIKVEDLPAAVTAGFKRDFPNATISEAEQKTAKDGALHYELEYKDTDGKEHEVEYTADGQKLAAAAHK